jgi:hypothetical protein
MGSTQPLVKMSTRNIPGNKAGAWGWQPHHLHVPNVMEIREPKPPGTLWATPGRLPLLNIFISRINLAYYSYHNICVVLCYVCCYAFPYRIQLNCNWIPLKMAYLSCGMCRSRWPHSLRRGPAAARWLGLRVRIPQGESLPLVNVVFLHVEVSATDWSLVQRRPTDCGVSVGVIAKRL